MIFFFFYPNAFWANAVKTVSQYFQNQSAPFA